MDMWGYIASLVMGITLGVFGGGGSIMTVPIMVYLFGVSPLMATGYSLFVVGLTALIGSLMYIRKGDVDFKVTLLFALPSIVGVYISRAIWIPMLPDDVLHLENFTLTKDVLVMISFAALMIGASYSMIKKSRKHQSMNTNPLLKTTLIGTLGFIVGLIAGFVGAGGGFLIIPALVIITGLPMRLAIGTSLLIIATQSLFGFAGDVARGLMVNWTLLGGVAAAAIIGITFGFTFAHKVSEQKLKIAFGWFVLLMGTTILIEQTRHLWSL